MKVPVKCFRDFLTESEMSANFEDLPTEDLTQVVEAVILRWCKENIGASFQGKCTTEHSLWVKTFSSREKKHRHCERF